MYIPIPAYPTSALATNAKTSLRTVVLCCLALPFCAISGHLLDNEIEYSNYVLHTNVQELLHGDIKTLCIQE